MTKLEAMQIQRDDMMQMLGSYQNASKRLLTVAADQIAALKVDIADLELKIIVAGGRLTD